MSGCGAGGPEIGSLRIGRRPRNGSRTAPPARVVAVIERLRRLRMTSTAIAAKLEMAVSTVGAVLARIGSASLVAARAARATESVLPASSR